MWISLAFFAFLSVGSGLEIKANIPPNLRECYNDSAITTRDNLLPFTVTTLISLIRKLEDSVTADMRVLTSAILHRFRFDGIERNPNVPWSEVVIPFSPTGSEFPLFKVLFERLIPSTQSIPNNTLTYKERCTLHAMLSSSIDPWDRGDNDAPCSKISKYSSSNTWDWGGNSGNGFRFPREVSKLHDAEVFDPKVGPTIDEDAHRFPHAEPPHSGNFQQYMGPGQETQCPVESGVIYNKFGTVSAGIVLAGIATGLQQENVNILNLLNVASPRNSLRRSQQPTNRPMYGQRKYDFGSRLKTGSGGGYGGSSYGTIDNRHAATLAGVISEVSLLLGPTMDTQAGGLKIGMNGGWNDTAIPKYYFIKDYIKNALSDPKLRGSIDGLLLAKEVKKWSDLTSGSLKLSQVLGMYYSDRGLFGTNIKACSRRDHISDVAPDSELKDQGSAFALVLEDNLPSSVSISPEGIQHYVTTATDDTLHYISNSLTDVCSSGTSTTTTYTQTPAVDLHVVVDTNYDYREISKIVTYLVDNLEVNKYSSNFSLLNGFDGTVIIESSQSPLDFYSNFTYTTYNSLRKGFDFDRMLTVVRERFKDKLRYDALTSSGGGNARVVLFIPQASAAVNNKDVLMDRVNSLKVRVPDVKLLYLLLGGSKEKFSPFAEEPDKDVLVVSVFTDIAQSIDPVIKRISAVPKRIINPRCGPTWSSSSWYNTVTFRGFLQKPEIHYYRIHPNYFYRDTNAKITVRNEDHTQPITVCSSRSIEQPITNYTKPSSYTDMNCKTLNGGQEDLISVKSDDCPESYAIQCKPHYISVSTGQSTITQASNVVSCTDADCEYPNMIKFTISHQGLGCYSGVGRILGAPLIISLLVFINTLR